MFVIQCVVGENEIDSVTPVAVTQQKQCALEYARRLSSAFLECLKLQDALLAEHEAANPSQEADSDSWPSESLCTRIQAPLEQAVPGACLPKIFTPVSTLWRTVCAGSVTFHVTSAPLLPTLASPNKP